MPIISATGELTDLPAMFEAKYVVLPRAPRFAFGDGGTDFKLVARGRFAEDATSRRFWLHGAARSGITSGIFWGTGGAMRG